MLQAPFQKIREDADTFRSYGEVRLAELLETVCATLDRAWKDWWVEPLTLEQAQEESGYSRDSLYRFLHERKVLNYGSIEDPRIRRIDLPMKPGHSRDLNAKAVRVVPTPRPQVSSRSQVVRAIVQGG